MDRLKIIFMGTPDFAVPALDALAAAGHDILCAYTQPPRPAGRGQQPQLAPVAARAAALGIPVRHPEGLKGEAEKADFAALGADVAVVAAYGLILPRAVLAAPRLGCVNIHASLLPRWRGAAPIQRAILAGDEETGICVMRMEAGLDTGPVIARQSLAIGQMTGGQLHDALAALGGAMIVPALAAFASGQVTPEPQPEDGVTYAAKLDKDEGRLDFTRPATDLARQIRALTPWPGCFAQAGGERLKIIAARPVPGRGQPGQVLDGELTVACGEGALRIDRVQRPGRAPMGGAELLRGFALEGFDP